MVNMTNYEEYMLLYADGELNHEDEQALLAFVAQHPELQAELKAYAATRLQPDTTIVFEGKEDLMKDEPRKGAIWLNGWKTYAAAASVILFIALFAINHSGEKQTTEQPVTIQELTPPKTTADTPPEKAIAQQETTVEEHTLPAKEVHSTKPVDAVAVETKQKTQAQAPVETEPVQQQPRAKPEEKVAVERVQPAVETEKKQPETVIVKTEARGQDEHIKEEPAEEIIAVSEPKKKNRFIASVLGSKPQIFNEIETVVNDKVVIAKNVKDQLKDTDVTFRIGKKELFTVRL
ncbi:MAG: hypothetical protein KDC07_00390 [Chitinophagaceae bacterium]|nr:hypothetical protein [Chitinophagaceae bacterium]MCB9044841.1 hypothetical protein [Chitinophagales bacterium]